MSAARYADILAALGRRLPSDSDQELALPECRPG